VNRFLVIAFFLQLPGITRAQSAAGLTAIRDTSYTIAGEYHKHLKHHPNIGIAANLPYPSVKTANSISYCQTPERALQLDVFYQDEKPQRKRTAIIFIHGGGWRSGNKNMHHALLKKLAWMGYVCIAPEYRLSTEALYPAAIYDIKTAIRWTRKNAARYDIDINKIVVAGHSAGGELAAFMGATNGKKTFEGKGGYSGFSSKANAVIDLDGTLAFIHPESGEGDDSKKTSAATYWFGYSKTENPARWEEAAPLSHAGKHCPPVQFINSSAARMHAGRDDFIRILNKYHIYSEVNTLEGAPHSFLLFHPWFDTTVAHMHRFLQKIFPVSKNKIKEIIVAKDGSGQFSTVQEAINAIPLYNREPITIRIKKGIYKEKLLLDSTRLFVTLAGEDPLHTILTYNDHTGKLAPNGDTINTRSSWSCKIMANEFTAKNISFQNDAGFSAGQAVAVEANGDKAQFINCRFLGNQDVLFLNAEKARSFFKNCYIEGTTDFIFGAGTAWFENCHIHSKKNSHITAASTPKEKDFGFVFNECLLTGDTSLHNVSLGRPWRPYAQVLYMNCWMGAHIKTEGWSVWNNNENHRTARYAEYKNSGPSALPALRVSWSKQLTDAEARNFNIKGVLYGWMPEGQH
jgi:pectinesterase